MSLRIDYEPRLSDPYGYRYEDDAIYSGPLPCEDDCDCPRCMQELYACCCECAGVPTGRCADPNCECHGISDDLEAGRTEKGRAA